MENSRRDAASDFNRQFFDSHQGDGKLEICGKLAIVRSILEAERSSLLYIDATYENTTLAYEALENTWFNAFMQLLTENCRVDQLEERLASIGLVVFNYDRCIEHFLFHGSRRTTELSQNVQLLSFVDSQFTIPMEW